MTAMTYVVADMKVEHGTQLTVVLCGLHLLQRNQISKKFTEWKRFTKTSTLVWESFFSQKSVASF